MNHEPRVWYSTCPPVRRSSVPLDERLVLASWASVLAHSTATPLSWMPYSARRKLVFYCHPQSWWHVVSTTGFVFTTDVLSQHTALYCTGGNQQQQFQKMVTHYSPLSSATVLELMTLTGVFTYAFVVGCVDFCLHDALYHREYAAISSEFFRQHYKFRHFWTGGVYFASKRALSFVCFDAGMMLSQRFWGKETSSAPRDLLCGFAASFLCTRNINRVVTNMKKGWGSSQQQQQQLFSFGALKRRAASVAWFELRLPLVLLMYNASVLFLRENRNKSNNNEVISSSPSASNRQRKEAFERQYSPKGG